MILSWDTLKRLHKINTYLATVASEIEDLGIDAAEISDKLIQFAGISIWKLRDICDFMCKVETIETQRTRKFELYLQGNEEIRKELDLPLDYNI